MSWYYFRPYVSAAQRRAKAARHGARLAKKEKRTLAPIVLEGRKIAESFWGKAWCENLERYSDFENRLPRGRTYVRNGSIIDLQIKRGKVTAIVSGSDIYEVTIDITTLPAATWSRLKKDCTRSIASLIDLLQGRFDQGVMARLSQKAGGLFPQPREIKMECTCPDWATMCKHVAAVLYGVGTRLDKAPELLFTLRAVDHLELISQAVDAENLGQSLKSKGKSSLAESDLGEIFGIELDAGDNKRAAKKAKPRAARRVANAKASMPTTRKRTSARAKAAH